MLNIYKGIVQEDVCNWKMNKIEYKVVCDTDYSNACTRVSIGGVIELNKSMCFD